MAIAYVEYGGLVDEGCVGLPGASDPNVFCDCTGNVQGCSFNADFAVPCAISKMFMQVI